MAVLWALLVLRRHAGSSGTGAHSPAGHATGQPSGRFHRDGEQAGSLAPGGLMKRRLKVRPRKLAGKWLMLGRRLLRLSAVAPRETLWLSWLIFSAVFAISNSFRPWSNDVALEGAARSLRLKQTRQGK